MDLFQERKGINMKECLESPSQLQEVISINWPDWSVWNMVGSLL